MADIFYSVGTNTADLKAAATVSITSGVATFSAAQSNSIGIGDVIDYGTDNKKAYISARTSSTVYNVVTKLGATPGDVSGVTVNSIKRVFNSLLTALGTSGFRSASYLNTTDLVTNTYKVYIPCYNDGANITTAVSVLTGLTTNASYNVNIFTPYLSTQVGTSQRHTGKEGTGYRLHNNDTDGYSITLRINQAYTIVEGLEIAYINTGYNYAEVSVEKTECKILKNIIHSSAQSGTFAGIVNFTSLPTNGKVYIINNIIYGKTGFLDVGIFSDYPNVSTAYIYNNTIINKGSGEAGFYLYGGNLTAYLKNNIVQNFTDDYKYDYITLTSEKNISQDATSPDGASYQSKTLMFKDTTNFDFRLVSSDTAAIGAATDLSADSYYPFNDDIKTNERSAPWDIGADQCTFSEITLPKITAQFTGTIGGIIGTFAFSFPKITAQFVGGKHYTGTLAGTLGKITAQFAGVFKRTGTLAGTLPIHAGQFAGFITRHATMALSLPNVAAQFAGVRKIVGSSALTLPQVQVQMAGKRIVVGTSTVILPAVQAQFAGTRKVVGTLSCNLPALQSQCVGHFNQTGTFGFSLPAVASLLVGNFDIAGGFSFDLPKVTSEFSGYITRHGTMALTLPMIQSSFSGIRKSVGSLTAILPIHQAQFDGVKTLHGTMGLTLPMIQSSFSGTRKSIGSFSFDFPQLTLLFNGHVTRHGTLSTILPVTQSEFNGVIKHTGILGVNLPAIQNQFVGNFKWTGSFTLDLPKITAQFVAHEEETGTLDAVLPIAVAQFIGGKHYTGTFTMTLPLCTVTINGMEEVIEILTLDSTIITEATIKSYIQD